MRYSQCVPSRYQLQPKAAVVCLPVPQSRFARGPSTEGQPDRRGRNAKPMAQVAGRCDSGERHRHPRRHSCSQSPRAPSGHVGNPVGANRHHLNDTHAGIPDHESDATPWLLTLTGAAPWTLATRGCHHRCRVVALPDRHSGLPSEQAFSLVLGAGLMAAKSAEARKVLRELDKELSAACARQGVNLVWSAAEASILAQIASVLDRKTGFLAAYEDASDVKTRLKISAEVRLLEGLAGRLVQLVKTDMAVSESTTTMKARRAANRRWERDRNAAG